MLAAEGAAGGGGVGMRKAGWRQVDCLESHSKEFGVYPADV